jgi:protein-tyrosine phosphatase
VFVLARARSLPFFPNGAPARWGTAKTAGTLGRVFVDVHSHVVPSGDDGVGSVAEGLDLCRQAAKLGTSVLFGTPHVWPHQPLTPEREEAVRAAHAEMVPAAAAFGLDLKLGFELTPATVLLEQGPRRYRLGDLPAVLMELPFAGPLDVAERLAEHVEAAGLTPVIAHPERADAILDEPERAEALAERGWLLQLNGTSLLGYHGRERKALAWRLIEGGHVAVIASDGHRQARPPFLDDAHRAARARIGEDEANALFDGSRLPGARPVPVPSR